MMAAQVSTRLRGDVMGLDDAKAIVQSWVGAFNRQDLDAAYDLLAADYVRHDANLPDVVGPEAEIQFIRGALTGFPDLQFSVQQLVAENNVVVARLKGRGTHRGEFLGVPPTGRQVSLVSMESFRVADGMLVEQWVVMDVLGLLQQLGAVPAS
jgi:steroid delta-isomerase-like uncharacterized protein